MFFHRNLPVLRLGHLPPDRLQCLPDTAPDHLIVIDQQGFSRNRTADVGERLNELGAVHRLHQIICCRPSSGPR
jgi:hypothetical protein